MDKIWKIERKNLKLTILNNNLTNMILSIFCNSPRLPCLIVHPIIGIEEYGQSKLLQHQERFLLGRVSVETRVVRRIERTGKGQDR